MLNEQPIQTSSGSQTMAPPRSSFVACPPSWYRFCCSADIDQKPFARSFYGRNLVAFRGADGAATVMDATCSHLGADLGRGTVVENCLQCPFHHWQYGTDGACKSIPGETSVPSFARQKTFPVSERDGNLYFFNGPKATFPLPFVLDETAEEYCSRRPSSFVTDCSWYMANAHAFDEKHFQTVHGRKLTAPIAVDTPHPYARRCRYRAEILVQSLSDRLLKAIAGDTVEISITIWGGTFAVVTGEFGSRRSRFFLITEPESEDKTRIDVVVFSPNQTNPLLRLLMQPLALRVRQYLTTKYLYGETESLGGPRYNQAGLTAMDQQLIEYFQWAAQITKSS